MLPDENVQSYPRPPLIERAAYPISLFCGDRLIAQTEAAWRVCETHHPPTYYLPPAAFPEGLLVPAQGASVCEWKGRAVYFDLKLDEGFLRTVSWAYPRPTAAYRALANHVAVYLRPPLRGFVAGIAATPQPGGFYGGWVTPNLTGLIKGAPGTEWW